jgi:hypothetical protein
MAGRDDSQESDRHSLFALGAVCALPLLLGIAVTWHLTGYYVEVGASVQTIAIALFVANFMCMAAGLPMDRY